MQSIDRQRLAPKMNRVADKSIVHCSMRSFITNISINCRIKIIISNVETLNTLYTILLSPQHHTPIIYNYCIRNCTNRLRELRHLTSIESKNFKNMNLCMAKTFRMRIGIDFQSEVVLRPGLRLAEDSFFCKSCVCLFVYEDISFGATNGNNGHLVHQTKTNHRWKNPD